MICDECETVAHCLKNGCVPKQPSKDEPHAVIAGALFDFMGWLTSRPKRIMLSSADDASPAVDAIKDFAKMRGLSLDDAQVQSWQEALADSALDRMAENARELGLDYEPVACVGPWHDARLTLIPRYSGQVFERDQPLYARPQSTAWRGLTDEERLHLVDTHVGFVTPAHPLSNDDWVDYASAIEAKLKEKNT